MASTKVEFYVALGGYIWPVTILPGKLLSQLFEGIMNENSNVLRHLKKYNVKDFSFKVLKTPVPADLSEEGAESTLQACLDKGNWIGTNPKMRVMSLSSEFNEDVVYLAIILTDRQVEAVGKLKQEHPLLFNLLRVRVDNRSRWSGQDVWQNGGHKVDYERAPPVIKEVTERLAHKRIYDPLRMDDEERKDFIRAQAYEEDFPKMFSPAQAEGDISITARPLEYFMFHRVLREYAANAVSVASCKSSSIKADTFRGSCIYPVFSPAPPDSHIFYDQETGWRFPIFVSFPSEDDGLRKYSPKSDFHVISIPFDFPLLIGEVISQRYEEERSRMLIQAMAVVRTGQYLMKPGGRKFTLVAIYFTGVLQVERYILTQGTGTHIWRPVHENTNIEQPIVNYTMQKFDLKIKDHAIRFFLEMLNLVKILNEIAGDIDQEKAGKLAKIQVQAKNVRSLHSKASGGSGPSEPTSLPTVSENSHRNNEHDSVLDSKKVKSLLKRMGYSITFRVDGNPNVAMVIGGYNNDFYGYIKFVERHKEIDILQYLSGLDSPMNYTIRPIEIWPVGQGSLVLMPRAGDHLTDLEEPSLHLWSTSRQLFEAIQFMHDNGVAHMDLKPQNIVIPAEYDKLTIIDFSLAVRLEKGDSFRGYVGTVPYIAPEVRDDSAYSAVRADLWSCGAVIQELCMLCEPSAARARLLEISSLLMDEDPMKRPMMKEVLEMISSSNAEDMPQW